MRYLIMSDIHGNLQAFEAVLSATPDFDQVWCLGDVVGYGPDPHECIARLRGLPAITVAGNHDWAVAGKLDLHEFNADAQEAVLWTREQVTRADVEFLKSLPERETSGDFTLVHGSPRHPVWEYILNASVARSNFERFDTRFCLVGHTHVPVLYALHTGDERSRVQTGRPAPGSVLELRDAPRMIINPGGVGQPRDAIPSAAYALYDSEAQTISFLRQEYDIEETQRRMTAAGLPPRLIARLTFGW